MRRVQQHRLPGNAGFHTLYHGLELQEQRYLRNQPVKGGTGCLEKKACLGGA